MTRSTTPRCRRPLDLCLALLVLATLSAFSTTRAAEADVGKAFDIPAAPAERSLKEFMTQAGVDVVYPAELVRNVRTPALKGTLPPAAALERLLADTQLAATRDTRSGTFILSARPNEPGTAPVPVAVPRSVAPAVNTDRTSEAIVLSPFEVHVEKDTGFAAASSLAGGRLAGDLRDTPVAYSVITRDFIDALGITDLAGAASWTTNSIENITAFSSDVSNQPVTYTVRGVNSVSSGTRMRNFFRYFSPMDSYSLERFDFGRGPNAVLFGNGSLGGVSSSTTKRARFDSTFGTLAQEVGSWNRFRTTLDVNRPLNDKFAVRTALVWSDRDGWRDREFDKMKAIFLTGTFKLAQHTSVRIEGEYGRMSRTTAFTSLNDRFSGWSGADTYSGPLATLPANANAIGIGRRPANYIVYDPFSGQGAAMNYQNDPFTLSGGANAGVPIGGFFQVGARPLGTTDAPILHALAIPGNRFGNAIAGSAFRVPTGEFTVSSDAANVEQRFQDLQLTVDHRIGPVFLQLAADFNRSSMQNRTGDLRGAPNIHIDINRLLPNGASNPHFLQPYSDLALRTNIPVINEADALRLAAGMTRDLGKWGRYAFNLMGETLENRFGQTALNLSFAQDPDRRRWGDPSQALLVRRYWNEPSRPYSVPANLRYIDPVTGISRDIAPLWTVENNNPQSFTRGRFRFKNALGSLNAKFFDDRLVLVGALRLDDYSLVSRQQILQGDYPADWDGVTGYLRPAAPPDYFALAYTPRDANGNPLGPPIEAAARPRAGNGDRLPQYAGDRFQDDYGPPDVGGSQITKTVGAVWHPTAWLSPSINYAETFNFPVSAPRIGGF